MTGEPDLHSSPDKNGSLLLPEDRLSVPGPQTENSRQGPDGCRGNTVARVRHFYEVGRGWNMFNAAYLTPALRHYLQQEKTVLGNLVGSQPIGHLLEVGCGYGRFMKWALGQKLHYDGFEIVPWLADLAALGAGFHKAAHPALRCRIHNHCVSEMENAFADAPALQQQARLVFFPFNCFGNLADRDEVVAAIASHASHALVSSFQVSKEATEQRARYYTHCGFTNVTCKEDDKGILATAEQGLHSYAYRQEFLEALFAGYGFQLRRESEFGGIGLAYHWTSTAPSWTTTTTAVPAFAAPPCAAVTPNSGIEVTVIEEEEAGAESTGLVNFRPRPAIVRQLSSTDALLECPQRLECNQMVKMDFQASPVKSAIVVGTVRHVEEIAPSGYLVRIEFFQKSLDISVSQEPR